MVSEVIVQFTIISSLGCRRPALASVMAPHNSIMKSSVKANSCRSLLSMASANSMLFVFASAVSQIRAAMSKK